MASEASRGSSKKAAKRARRRSRVLENEIKENEELARMKLQLEQQVAGLEKMEKRHRSAGSSSAMDEDEVKRRKANDDALRPVLEEMKKDQEMDEVFEDDSVVAAQNLDGTWLHEIETQERKTDDVPAEIELVEGVEDPLYN